MNTPEALAAFVQRKGHDDTDRCSQPDAIPAAEWFLTHYAALLRDGHPLNGAGPLASLITSAREFERRRIVEVLYKMNKETAAITIEDEPA